ncbi:helix-turn-helix transcriptional regulator [Nocardioides sp. cx-169]|uniref:helix-turn-helix domain-containing protein n=1 Tax=Nocardioides sp. cx-169 TaxID=2899080 RepID=UPI001E3CCC57|nr:helix-turn-helix transcriptional regulator [Nocardioides sp. cx-169]MCD4532509.1 helix-turn-helix transcriptional regulator [Nocardioides sp. cx-169]
MIDTTQLRALRVDRGYSIRSLAKSAGVDHQTIRRLENGADPGDLPLRVLDRIAAALGVIPATLLATEREVEQHDLQRRIGGLLLSAQGITTTAVATSLATPIETVEEAIPALVDALAEAGLTVGRHGDTLRINPLELHSTAHADTRPMTLNEARLLRRIHRGEDIRRSLSKADRELTLPRLIRTGLVDPAPAILVSRDDICGHPYASDLTET